jgi:iron complex outermembrane receptor protein
MNLIPFPLRRSLLLLSMTIGAFFPAISSAQNSGSGAITGRVFNPATGEYVRNAEVRLEGTNQLVTTESDGSFVLNNVPAGAATIAVSYTGYRTATQKVDVASGGTASATVNLTSALEKSDTSSDLIKLDAFKVSTEREGNAKAIMDQKQAMTVSNIVASDTFGNQAGGNVGEFLKYLPGIQMDYVEADARNPRIRGLPAQYTTVTFGGMDIASADGFIQNNGTDNSGGAGSAGRSFGFDSVSMASVDAIEVSFTTNASQGAGAAAGSIDLRPKHAYERNGQQVGVDVSVMANSEELFWHKAVRPDDKPNRLILPNGKFEYGNSFFNNRLGILFSVNESNFFNEQRQYVPTYDTTPTAASPDPIVITRIQYKDGPKFTEQSTMSFTVDFKATDKLAFSLIGINSNYGMFTSNRSFGVSTTRANLVGHGNGWTSWDNVPVTSITAAASAAYLRKRTHGYSYLPSFEYKSGGLFVTGALIASASENNYAGNESYKLPGANLGGVSLPATGVTVSAIRSADDLYSWKVIQTGGPDWSNIANYKATATGTPTFGYDGRYNRTLIYQAKLDVRYSLPISMPTWIKMGGKVSETTYLYQNLTNWLSWNYVGPGGGLGGSWAQYPSAAVFSQGHGGYFLSTTGGTPAIADHNTVGKLFESHPEYFVHNDSPSNFLASLINNPKYIREQVDALYGMFDTRPFNRLELQAGVRWERTRDETKDFDPLGSAAVVAAGYAVSATTGQATTIPGMQYQYFTKPRVARSARYDGLFPSAGVKYLLRPNLQALFGYSYTLTRPAYGDLSGSYSENDTTLEITAPNPNLTPQYANNYSAQLAYYFEPVGKFVVGVFENDIKNFQQTTRIKGAASDISGFEDPFYSLYTLVQKNNIDGTVRYRGATLDYSQTLSFLPGPFKGLSVFANYARTYTTLKVPDETQLHVANSPYNFGWLPGIAPHVISGGVTYKYHRFTVGVKGRWQADMGTTNTYNTWMQQNTKYDVNAEYAIGQRWKVYFYSRNITNVPDHTFVGKNRQQIGGGRAIEYYGAYLYAGVKAQF